MKFRAYRHWIVFTKGYRLLKKGRWQEAASAFRRAIELNPDHPWAHNHLGIALLKLGEWEQALAACQCAIRLNPEAFDAHMNFGIALLKLARWEEAAAAYERAIDRSPPSAQLYEKQGLALSRLGRAEEAAAAFRRATELDGDNPETYPYLGAMLIELERWEEAAAVYRRALSLDPGALQSYGGLATAMLRLESSGDAMAEHRRAIEKSPQNAVAHLCLAIELLKLGRWAEAASALERGRALVPDCASFHFLLVSPLIKLGRGQDAVQAYRRALELGGVLPSTPGRDTATTIESRHASFWTAENLGVETLRIERWLESLASVPGGSPSPTEPDPDCPVPDRIGRFLFVLDNDYGELTTLMYLLLGQPLIAQTMLLLPHRLNADNAEALPGRTRLYRSLDDVVEVVDREKPDIVFLCSGYLFSIHGIFSLSELEHLVVQLSDRGCRIVTTDPFLGVLSQQDARTVVSIDIPGEAGRDGKGSRSKFRSEDLQKLRAIKQVEDERLRTHFSRCEKILRSLHHLYPSYCDLPQHRTTVHDSRNLSFFNSELICPELVSRERGSGARGAPRWVFILSRTDLDTQMMFEGAEGFADIVAEKLMETLAAGRHPILIGPNELLGLLAGRLPATEGIDMQPYCSFHQLMSLLLSAEYAFYWNVLSHSILIRLFNKLPVVVFDRGHLLRNVTAMYDRVVGWYYQGWEPPLTHHRQPLTPAAVSARAEPYRQAADRMVERFRRAPTPGQMIQSLLAER